MNKEILKDFCLSLGLDAVGIASVDLPPEDLQSPICPLAAGQGKSRYDPRRIMPDCRSLIVVLFPYFYGYPPESNLALYCHGPDYHNVIKSYLHKIGTFLRSDDATLTYMPVADTSPLADRLLARMAGLGFIGDNQCLINEKYGSYCFIGTILVNRFFEPDSPSAGECLHCRACSHSCPGRCFALDRTYDYRLCKSYLTQKKGDLMAKEIAVIRKTAYIFGCDECQRVCPHNASVAVTPLPEFREDLLPYLDATELEPMTNGEFKERYGTRAFSWRGKKILIRNAEYLRSTLKK